MQYLLKMYKSTRLLRLRNIKPCICGIPNIAQKTYSKKSDSNVENFIEKDTNLTLGNMGRKYEVFREEDSKEILDVYEERLRYSELLEIEEAEAPDPFEGLNLERGLTGVFDIEDLVAVLKRENAEDIFVVSVPPDVKYVDYICIVTGKSFRHMDAIMQFVRKVYKQKRHNYDRIPKLEGADSRKWMAIDLGNIALHVFARDTRAEYDLESLWSVGPKYDGECNKKDAIVDMLEKHSIYLKDLTPAS